MRVQNTTDDKTLPAADAVRDRRHAGAHASRRSQLDGQPVRLRARSRSRPQAVVPSPNSPAGEGVIQGSLILFKLTTEALANRPLEFKIASPARPDDVGTVDLDV